MLKRLYRAIRLLPKKRKEPYASLYKILGFYPYNITLYNQALAHKSFSIKIAKGRWINNERLEFLGDAILDAIVADIVFKEFEYKKEGFLTTLRSSIVQRETLNKLALDLGLDKLVKMSSSKCPSNYTHVYGNALEAIIGAIYLDWGYRVAKKFVKEKLIDKHLSMKDVVEKSVNYKSSLIEWGQKNKINIEFVLVDSFINAQNMSSFVSEVRIHGESLGSGSGSSKKESQRLASQEALAKIKSNPDRYLNISSEQKIENNTSLPENLSNFENTLNKDEDEKRESE